VAQAHLAAGLQVVGVVVERTSLAARHQLGHRWKLALAHGRFEVGARLAMHAALAAPPLGQQNVAFATQRRELLLDGPHSLSNVGDSSLDLTVVEGAEVVCHQTRCRRRMRNAAATINITTAAILMALLAVLLAPAGCAAGIPVC